MWFSVQPHSKVILEGTRCITLKYNVTGAHAPEQAITPFVGQETASLSGQHLLSANCWKFQLVVLVVFLIAVD